MSRSIGYQDRLKNKDFSLMMGSRKINILWLVIDLKK